MTLAEAIKAGYTMFGYSNYDEYQEFKNLSEATVDDFITEYPIRLVSKEPYYASITAKDAKDLMANHVMKMAYKEHSLRAFDEKDKLPAKLVKDVDWQVIADTINKVCNSEPYYFLSEIELTYD